MKKLLIALIIILAIVPFFAFAQEACSPGYTGTSLCNAIPRFGGLNINDLQGFIIGIFSWIAGIIGTILMAVLIYSGIKMVLSQGDLGKVKEAKASFTYAILGFLVTIFGYVIVSSVQYFIGVRQGDPEQERNFFFNPLRDSTLIGFLETTMTNVLGVVGAVVLFYLVWNGFKYILAGSNEEQTKAAKLAITWSIIGLISILASYTIVKVLIDTFGKYT